MYRGICSGMFHVMYDTDRYTHVPWIAVEDCICINQDTDPGFDLIQGRNQVLINQSNV